MSGERYILELLWSIENHKHTDRFLCTVSDILRGNLELDEVLFYLMSREHALSKIKISSEFKDAPNLFEAMHQKTFTRSECLALVRDITMSFEGEDVSGYFMEEIKQVLGDLGFLKVSEFVIEMVEIFSRLHHEGLTPTIKKLNLSPINE